MSGHLAAAAKSARPHDAPVPLLLNADAGKLKETAGPDEILRIAAANAVAVEPVAILSAGEMRRTLIRYRNQGVPRVAVAGGDGTVHQAAQALAESNTALGILPQGTANNFATALRLPLDLPSALLVLRDGVERRVDLGYVCGEFFTESAGVGLFADALASYGRANKNLWRALIAIARVVLALRASRIRLTVDGVVVAERAVMCAVANSFRMAYALPIAPRAKVTDGELDVVVLGDLTRAELLPYFRAIRAQLHQGLPKVTTLRGKVVGIESRRPMAVHCDDRVLCRTPVEVRARPGALRVLVERL